MEQKLLEPSYKSQWQYKVLDLNTHKINDQVGIQHAYIIRFLQLKKKTHPILCRTPCQVSSCINPVHRQKLSAPNGVRLPLPLVLDLEVEHDEPHNPKAIYSAAWSTSLISFHHQIRPTHPFWGVLPERSSPLFTGFWCHLRAWFRPRLPMFPGGVCFRVSMCWSPCVSATNGIL